MASNCSCLDMYLACKSWASHRNFDLKVFVTVDLTSNRWWDLQLLVGKLDILTSPELFGQGLCSS